ncbi:hypothetical protein MR810_01990 [bacterium]|nr:hypothetical protein [bacterium]
MKKRILSMLLCLCMVLALIPATAMAEEAGTLAVTVEGFEVGKTPEDCTLSFESTIPGVTFSKEDIQFYKWEALVPTEEGAYYISPLRDNEAFKADMCYRLRLDLDNKGLEEAPAVTVNGKTPEICYIKTSNGQPILITIGCDFGTPPEPEPVITLTVPFTTTVKLGGNVAPGETTFDLAIAGSNAGDADISDVTVSGSVTTNGAGDYDGTLTFTGTERSLWLMLSEGAFVQQVNAGEAGWTYDDTVWGVLMEEIPVAYAMGDDATVSGYTVYAVPASIDGNGYYYIDWENLQAADMAFTNIYTKSVFEPAENDPVPGNPDLPQTGDNSSMILRTALLLVSGSAVIGMIAAGKKKKYNR